MKLPIIPFHGNTAKTSGVKSVMAGSPRLPAMLIFFMVFFAADLRAASNPSKGVSVLLPHPCSSHGDSRDLVIRYLPDEKLWLNEEAMDRVSPMLSSKIRFVLIFPEQR